MENIFVSPTDLSGPLGTKRNLYDILFIDGKFISIRLALVELYLPPFERCLTFFLKELLAKRKLVSLHIISKIICKNKLLSKMKRLCFKFQDIKS